MTHDPPGRTAARAEAVAFRATEGRWTDRGSATLGALTAMLVLTVVFGALLTMAQVVVARHRAGGAADLAALAAADHWSQGRADACARAARVALAQRTRIVRCALLGEISDVTVAADLGPFSPEARSRAGPAGPDWDS
jgi:secretion/DNA translocation related TadE-like protein